MRFAANFGQDQRPVVLATKKTSQIILVGLSSIEINPFLKLHCNICCYAVLVTLLFQNVSCSKCLLLMELVTEMLFLPEQFSFIAYVFAVNFHVFQY